MNKFDLFVMLAVLLFFCGVWFFAMVPEIRRKIGEM